MVSMQCATIELWMHSRGFPSTRDARVRTRLSPRGFLSTREARVRTQVIASYASFVLSNLPLATITR